MEPASTASVRPKNAARATACAAARVQRRATVRADDETLKLLLISDESDKAAMLRQLMEQQGLCGEIRRLDPGKSAVACARQSGPYKGEASTDLILLDFSAANSRAVSMVQRIALASPPIRTPVILLTSVESEKVLHTGELEFDDSRVFAPTSLLCLIRKMQQHSRRRFLRALSVMAELGPILVRLPAALMRQHSDDKALIA